MLHNMYIYWFSNGYRVRVVWGVERKGWLQRRYSRVCNIQLKIASLLIIIHKMNYFLLVHSKAQVQHNRTIKVTEVREKYASWIKQSKDRVKQSKTSLLRSYNHASQQSFIPHIFYPRIQSLSLTWINRRHLLFRSSIRVLPRDRLDSILTIHAATWLL